MVDPEFYRGWRMDRRGMLTGSAAALALAAARRSVAAPTARAFDALMG